MTIVKDGYPFILGALAVALAVWFWAGIVWCIPFLVLSAYFAYFFRNPNRPTEQDNSIIYSPADGTVMAVEDFYDEEYLNEDAVKVTTLTKTPLRLPFSFLFLMCMSTAALWQARLNISVTPAASLCLRMKKT